MELTKLNSINNLSYVNDVKEGQKTQALISDSKVKANLQSNKSEGVEVNLKQSSNSFKNNISSSITKVAGLQKAQSQISNQLEITTKIVSTTSNAVNSSSIQLDDKQPEIKNLLDNFNQISNSSELENGSDETGIFFDGVLGSKPLSASEILQAVEKQQTRLETSSKQISAEIQAIVSNTQASFETEKSKIETKVEFKNIDYGQESANFSADSLKNVKENIIPSQANATPTNSQQLLA